MLDNPQICNFDEDVQLCPGIMQLAPQVVEFTWQYYVEAVTWPGDFPFT